MSNLGVPDDMGCNLLVALAVALMAWEPASASAEAGSHPTNGTRPVTTQTGELSRAISEARAGDVLLLAPGRHQGPVTLDRPLTIDGRGKAEIAGTGKGSVIIVTGEDVVIRNLKVVNSGSDHQPINSGIFVAETSARAVIEDNLVEGNLHGITVHGGRDTVVRANTVIGRRDHRLNDRGNGIYVWNAPGTIVEGNDIRYGRDGIFSNYSKLNVFRGNVMRDLRFAVHYMYTNDSEVTGNVSIGNRLGYALMFSTNIRAKDNLSLRDHGHGIMLNYTNNSVVQGNLVRGKTHEKCAFIYNAHKNTISGNRFEGCGIGIHFTAGSERNLISGNAFISNREQVKYVGTKLVEWSAEGRGNYWSDHPAFDLDGNGLADSKFKPNDLMDHILWSQPAAMMLLGSPAVQLIRWSQQAFPALMPGGVVDSYPVLKPVDIAVPEAVAALEQAARPDWLEGGSDANFDAQSSH